MSDIHIRNIQAFIRLLETQPDLFSAHVHALEELEASLPEDIKELSDAIEEWYESRIDIFKAHVEMSKTLLKDKSGTYRGPGGVSSFPLPSKRELRKEIVNVIRVNRDPASRRKKVKNGEAGSEEVRSEK